MARTYISVLTEDKWVETTLSNSIKSANYSFGYVGNNEQDFIQYLKRNNIANHILIVKPTLAYQSAYNETNLRSFSKIDVIITGAPLRQEHIPLIQSSHISGYIDSSTISPLVIKDLAEQLYRNGYYANEQIPKSLWINRPKKRQEYAKPKFTRSETKILDYLCHGFTAADIGFLTNTTEASVRFHIKNLKTKTQSYNVNALVAIAVENNWVYLTREKFKRHNPYILNPTR